MLLCSSWFLFLSHLPRLHQNLCNLVDIWSCFLPFLEMMMCLEQTFAVSNSVEGNFDVSFIGLIFI